MGRIEKAQAIKTQLSARAAALGFDCCRVVRPDAAPDAARALDEWLAQGLAGTMNWMHETAKRRREPRALWPEVRSVVMLGMNYCAGSDPLASLAARERGTISAYARNRDYHDVIKGRLKMLAQWMLSAAAHTPEQGEALKPDVKVFVDTAPVMEKPLAAAAGIGWQGKHTNLVSRDFGSWLFLGSIFTTLDIQPDEAGADSCGSCRACLDICPTAAFPSPYRLDARRCISYLTIEHKGHIAAEFRKPMGNRIYGCDDCLAVCPWNKFAQAARETKLQAREELKAPALADLLRLDEAGFRALFAGTPVKRVGHERFLRNILIAAGNSGAAALLPLITDKMQHPSAVVRAMAVWAAGQIAAPPALQSLAERHKAGETDEVVRAEWRQALTRRLGQSKE